MVVPAGARLPGVPATNGFADLVFTPGGYAGFSAALEVQHTGAIYVNERNSDAAPSATIGNVRVSFEQHAPQIALSEFVRLNNFTNRNYVGSVIVGDTNGRYFEPAPRRNWFAGVTMRVAF
jgi:iron complex outermembrane receptor protein